jgi:hypothetical protein
MRGHELGLTDGGVRHKQAGQCQAKDGAQTSGSLGAVEEAHGNIRLWFLAEEILHIGRGIGKGEAQMSKSDTNLKAERQEAQPRNTKKPGRETGLEAGV